MKPADLVPMIPEISERIDACRNELKALKRLLNAAKNARDADRAKASRNQNTQVASLVHSVVARDRFGNDML